MTFDNAIKALSLDALKYVRNGYVIGLVVVELQLY